MKVGVIKTFILDASVTLPWCFEDEPSAYAEGVLDLLGQEFEAVVPAVWPLEITNALLSALRKKRITQTKAVSFLERLRGLPIAVEEASLARVFDHIFLQSQASQVTSYDGSYLELAMRKHVPLATLDEPLLKAAQALGVEILQLKP